MRRIQAEPPSMWPRFLGLLGLSVAGAGLLLAGLWPVAIVIVIVGLALFNYLTSRQVRRIEADFAAAGLEPDYSEADARDFKRSGLGAAAMLMVLLVVLIAWTVVSAAR